MKTQIKIIHWLPRILCILAILFISVFALDAFEPEKTMKEQLLAFLIHLIPSFILSIFLLIAWRWELTGGIIFTAIGLFFTPILFIHNFRMNQSVWMSLLLVSLIPIPFLIVGLLFIKSYKMKKGTSILK